MPGRDSRPPRWVCIPWDSCMCIRYRVPCRIPRCPVRNNLCLFQITRYPVPFRSISWRPGWQGATTLGAGRKTPKMALLVTILIGPGLATPTSYPCFRNIRLHVVRHGPENRRIDNARHFEVPSSKEIRKDSGRRIHS